MRKIREVLRLSAKGLTQHQIARSCSIVQSTVHKYLKLAEAAGLRWPLPEDWGDARIREVLLGSQPVIGQTGSTPNVYLYRGEQFDAALELYYLRARWIQPKSGRFITADIWQGIERDPLSVHQYSYAEGDPMQNVDPTGFANNIESSFLTSLFTRIAPIVQQVSLRAVVGAGQTVARGTRVAYHAVCCLDKAWAALDLTLMAITAAEGQEAFQEFLVSPAHIALMTITIACRFGCPPPRVGDRVYRTFGGPVAAQGRSWTPMERLG